MAENKSIVKNYAYNLIYQVFLLVVPLVLTPYVARVLGEDGSGQYSWAFSTVSIISLFAALGFRYYAQRLVASHQGDAEQQAIDFWEIILVRLIPVTVTLLAYFGMIFLNVFEEKYRVLMLLLSLDVIAVAFEITFYFQGNEEFGKIVVRNIIIKLLSIALIMIFVKRQEDLWKYTLIMSLSLLGGHLSMWAYIPKMLKKVKLSQLHPLKHLSPAFLLFLPTIATSVYTYLDKTMIGLVTHLDSENGNYEYAEKLVKVVMTCVTSLGTVIVPRNSKKFADGDIEGVKKNIHLSTRFVFFIGVPLTLGIIAVANNLAPWFLGDGYDKAANLMKILSPIILIIGLSNVFGVQLLVPSGEDRKFTIAIVSGAAANFGLNLLLISLLQSYGAAIATVLAEGVITGLMMIFVRKYLDFRKTFLDGSWRFYVSGAVMFVPCWLLGAYLPSSVLNTALIAVAGAAVYFGCLMLLRDDFLKMTVGFVRKKLLRR